MRGKFKTHPLVLAGSLIIWLICTASAQVKQDVSADLARAQTFYNSSQFQESLILLTELEKRIGTGPEQTNDLLKTKLYMGLAYMGLNQNDQAKSKFVEVCKLDGQYTLNRDMYPAKVISLYNEAKTACATPPPRDLAAQGESSIAQSTFLRGKELYEKGQFQDALKYFNVVLALDDKHELAKEYADLAQQRLEIQTQRGYTEWRLAFDAKQYDKAAAAYDRIRADQQTPAKEATKQIESEYQTTLSNLVAQWKAACATRELARLDPIRIEATNIAAGLPFGPDALAQLQPCAPRTPAPGLAGSSNKPLPTSTPAAPQPAPPTVQPAPANATPPPPQPFNDSRCIQGDPMLAMTRLKTRVNPQIEPALQRYIGRGIAVSIEIDEQGNVTVKDIVKANSRIAEAIKTAVVQWKFNPTIIDNQPRCVDTELPITAIQP
jgi:tetratricopeptide (TPR) repeat protein